MQPPCARSARSTFVNREAVVDQLRGAAKRLQREHPEVLRAYCFGSFAHGTPTPRSDADVLLVVASSDKPPRQRGPLFIDCFVEVSAPVDLFVLTAQEFEHAKGGVAGAARKGLRLI